MSPEGLFYDGTAHENRAKELLEIIYNEYVRNYAGDRLESLGWFRATTSLMWDIRLKSDYWTEKKFTQSQINALFDWCTLHKKKMPLF